jgi:hypothetical protein
VPRSFGRICRALASSASTPKGDADMKTIMFSALLLSGCFTPARETPTELVDRLTAECKEIDRRYGMDVSWCVGNRIAQMR